MFTSYFPRDVFAELDRLSQDIQQTIEQSPSIRGFGRGAFPALNIGVTPQSVEIYAFTAGLDPNSIDATIERGVLTLTGERKNALPAPNAKVSVHINERFEGRFRRVVSLPDDVDPANVEASYKEGVLHVSVKRKEETQPRKITIQ